jgi:g-D-glutamyl-meso-diaminopimelate peptidase
VLYNAEHHANEWITTPILLHFAEELASAFAAGEELSGVSAGELLDYATLVLIPAVNPDGMDLVTGELSSGEAFDQARVLAMNYPRYPFPSGWKANLRGVDLNLNYTARWEQARELKFAQGYDRPGPRDYVGPAPLSEPETEALAGLTERTEPGLTISLHSQGNVIYWKFGSMEPPGARELGERFAAVSGYALEDVPYASGFAGYKDWFILTRDRPGYTLELGSGENPLPLSQFDEIYAAALGILALGLAEG